MQYALVAGGSKGIGLAIAIALAKRNYHLILIARHLDKLTEAKNMLETAYQVSVEILQLDLSESTSAKQISKFCLTNNFPVSILCNVAGLGGADDYLAVPIEESRYMIHLNIESAPALIYHMLPVLVKNKQSYILNVASMAGFAPIPVKNMYSATKSAMIFFSRALRTQLKNKNVSVSCLCPGPVFTKPEIKKDTLEKLGWFGKQMAVEPEKVGEIAVRKTLQKKFMIIPGLVPKITSVVVRTLPDKLLVFIYGKMVENDNT